MTPSLLRMCSFAIVALAFACGLLFPDDAHARRRGGLVLITSGETIEHVQNVPEDMVDVAMDLTDRPVRVGYRYSSVGLFWIDAWTYDGAFVLYDGDDYWDLDEELSQGLLGKSLDELDTPPLYRFPPLLVLLIVGGLGFGVYKGVAHRRAAAHDDMLTGPAFQKAADIYASTGDNGLNAALDHLEAQGFDRAEALPNLMAVLRKRGLS